jgi:RimJ/RimL family protein N-acetyltransferase
LIEHRTPMNDTTTLETTATLKNGLAVTIRHLRPSDRDAIARAVSALDAETIYTRLFSHRPVTETAIDRIMRVDPAREVALVVVVGAPPDHQVIGSCRLIELEPKNGRRSAEIAFTVEEDYQGHGIAGRLLGHLIDIARARHIDELEADVLTGNRSMLRVFERNGLPMRTRREGSSVHLSLPLS